METKSRLRFDDTFYGRKKEKELLQSCYEKLPSLVYIGGFSGEGKSRLVSLFCSRKTNAYFCSGKCDEASTQIPFSSLIRAMSDLGTQICDRGEEELSRIRNELQEMDLDLQILVDLIPSLSRVVGLKKQSSVSSDMTENLVSDGSSNVQMGFKFTYIFIRFIRSVSTTSQPLILFLDDMQWQDESSLELLRCLFLDGALRNFMFIGAFRSNEVDQNHPLSHHLAEVKKQGNMTQIDLMGLSRSETSDMIANVLNAEVSVVERLADAVYDKTQGNIFYTKSMLENLVERQILTFSFTSYSWHWDIERVRDEVKVSDNVVSIVVERMKILDPNLQRLMTLAAYLPSSFHFDVLEKIVETVENGCEKKTAVLDRLEDAVTLGFLTNTIGSPYYRFSHDRIQQSSLLLVEEDERNSLSLLVGRLLLTLSENDSENGDRLLYTAVDRLNTVPSNIPGLNPQDLIKVNLEAGQRAARVSAHYPAMIYLKKAESLLQRLPGNKWKTMYGLTLKLYVSLANSEVTLGQLEEAEKHAKEIIANAETMGDKYAAYRILSESLGCQNRNLEAIKVDRKMLSFLGESTGNYDSAFLMLLKLLKMRKRLSKMSSEEFLGLPMSSDFTQNVIKDTLVRVFTRSTFCEKKTLLVRANVRILELSLQFGLSAATGPALATFANILYIVLEDHELGKRLSSLSKEILHKFPSKAYSPLVHFCTGSYIDPWMNPWTNCMKTFNKGYKEGMAAGSVEFSLMCLASHNAIALAQGLPLKPLLDDYDIVIRIILQYRMEGIRALFNPFHDFVRVLLGQIENIPQWLGDITMIRRKDVDQSQMTAVAWNFALRAQGAYFFDYLPQAYVCIENVLLLLDIDQYFFKVLTAYFYGSLVYNALYRQTKKRKYKRKCKKSMAVMANIVKNRGLTVFNKYLLLQADFASTYKKLEVNKIKTLFEKAISSSTKAGYVQDAALGNELVGEYFLGKGDTFWAKYHFSKAVELYRDWGASAKVGQLVKKRRDYIEEKVIGAQTSMRSSNLSRKVMLKEGVDVFKGGGSINSLHFESVSMESVALEDLTSTQSL